MKRNPETLYLKIWKLYKKKRNQKNFDKESFNKFLKYLEIKFNKGNDKPIQLYVIKETYLDGFEKPLHMLAYSIGFNDNYIWSVFGGIGQHKNYAKDNLIVHKGIMTVDDLEHNVQVIEEHRNWLLKKEEDFNKGL